MRTVLAAVPLAGAGIGVVALPALAAPYPPPDQPTTSTSASEVKAGDPVTVCAEHYHGDADVRLADDGKKVTTLHTDGTGRGCATIVWHSPHSTARPVRTSAVRRPDPGAASAPEAGLRLVALRAPSGTVCHTLTNTGPDASGAPATTQAQVCVEPAGSATGSTSSGGEVAPGGSGTGASSHSSEHGRLPFTGAEIAGLVAAALVAIAVGAAAVVTGRRRRA